VAPVVDQDRDWAAGVDIDVPSAARMYDYYLGGSHNFAADRAAADAVITALPSTRRIAIANRMFLGRVVRYLLSLGIRQFLDIGSGIPTAGNVHEVAQRVDPGARVAYVDIDPVAIAHSQRLLAGNPYAVAVGGSLLDPGEILADRRVRELIDFAEPVGLLLVSVLHFIPDADDPHAAVARLSAGLAPGSYVALSHGLLAGFEAGQAAAVRDVYRSTRTPAVLRPRPEIERFFAGYDVVAPGLVDMADWGPGGNDASDREPTGFLGGAGRRI
jgi:S-adenosyl methyltransferase